MFVFVDSRLAGNWQTPYFRMKEIIFQVAWSFSESVMHTWERFSVCSEKKKSWLATELLPAQFPSIVLSLWQLTKPFQPCCPYVVPRQCPNASQFSAVQVSLFLSRQSTDTHRTFKQILQFLLSSPYSLLRCLNSSVTWQPLWTLCSFHLELSTWVQKGRSGPDYLNRTWASHNLTNSLSTSKETQPRRFISKALRNL